MLFLSKTKNKPLEQTAESTKITRLLPTIQPLIQEKKENTKKIN